MRNTPMITTYNRVLAVMDEQVRGCSAEWARFECIFFDHFDFSFLVCYKNKNIMDKMQNTAKAITAKENAATAMLEMIPPLFSVPAIKTEGRIANTDATNVVNAGETLIILSRNDCKVTVGGHVRGNNAVGAVFASL